MAVAVSAEAVKVRPLEARDAARWRELFDGYLVFYKAVVAEDVIALTWQRLLSGSVGAHSSGASPADQPDALAKCRCARNRCS